MKQSGFEHNCVWYPVSDCCSLSMQAYKVCLKLVSDHRVVRNPLMVTWLLRNCVPTIFLGDLGGQIVARSIPMHINYAKNLAELISVCGAGLERQNKKSKNSKGVVIIPLMFGSFWHACHSVKQSVYVFYLALIYRRMQYRQNHGILKNQNPKYPNFMFVATN